MSYATPPGDRQDIDHARYSDAVLRELDARAPSFSGRRIESIFFGGGTPSLWEPRELGRVIDGVRRTLGVTGELEITVECNPSSLDEDKARALVDVGVGRLSIGVQSLRDEQLAFLGRLHDASEAVAAVLGAMRAGVSRVSADLIFGLPGQSAKAAAAEAIELVELGLAHLSCYQLTIEGGTRFGELARRGRLPLADDGVVADAFLAIDEALALRGLCHYEISNYSRPGQEARHNLGYWRGDEYLGLGCAAYGFARTDYSGEARGVRWRNALLPARYVDGAAPESIEPLDAQTLLRERIMLGLRRSEGLDLDLVSRDLRLGVSAWTAERSRASAWLEQRMRIVREGARVTIPRAAWLWTDDTAARLF